MQISLVTPLLSIVVFCSAVGAFDVYGFLVAPILLGIAACIRTATSVRNAATRILCYVCPPVLLLFFLLPCISHATEAMRQRSCMHNLENLIYALNRYHDAHGSLPPAHISDPNGKPTHSWRTLLLPYMACQDVYTRYSLTRPWDDPSNKKITDWCPLYFCYSNHLESMLEQGPTSYFAVVGSNTAWPEEKPLKLSDIPDGGRHTIMIVDVVNSETAWMEPRDLTVEEAIRAIRSGPHRKENGYFHHDQAGTNVAFADGSVRFLPADIPTETLEALLTINKEKAFSNIELLSELPEPRLHREHITGLVGSYVLLLFRPRRRKVADEHGAQA